MYALFLNPMTGNTENGSCVAIAETSEQLEVFLAGESTELYKDMGPNLFDGGEKNYHKSYKKDGPLEWFNSPENSFCEPSGIIEIDSIEDLEAVAKEWLYDATMKWDNNFGQALRL